MSKNMTAVGGFDGDDWLALATFLVSLGILPKNWRSAIGTAGTVLLVYRIAKRLGWL